MPTECAPVNAMAMKVVVKRRWRKVVRGLSGALCGDEVISRGIRISTQIYTLPSHTDGFTQYCMDLYATQIFLEFKFVL